MSGDLAPRPRDVRMSDAERERLVAQLQSAVSEGRLTLDEFQERVDGVLRSRTYGDVERYLADLPVARSAPREVAEIRSAASQLRRSGRWQVPRRLVVKNRAGSVKLDFTEAMIGFPVVEVVLDGLAGSTTIVLPDGASVDADDVEMVAGGMKIRKLPHDPVVGRGPHFVVTGTQKAGGLTIRRQYRFWRWRW